MKNFDTASAVLLFIGGINWGFVGLFNLDLIHFFVESDWGDRFIYALIAVAAIYRAVYYKSIRHRWKKEG